MTEDAGNLGELLPQAHLLTEVSDGKSLTRFYKAFGQKIRVTVQVDFYKGQSLATVDLLTGNNGWISLYVHPTDLWWNASSTDKSQVAVFILARALQILEP